MGLAQSRIDEARTALDTARAECPGDLAILRERCHFLFSRGTDDEAEASLRSLIDVDPADAGSYHNLGVGWWVRGRRWGSGDQWAGFFGTMIHRTVRARSRGTEPPARGYLE
jgi:hypothetical protein